MKYLSPSFNEIKESEPFKKIALVAHNCYQVEKDIGQKDFVLKLLGFGHYAMVEHYQFTASILQAYYQQLRLLDSRYLVLADDGHNYYVGFSLRILLETYKSNPSSPVCNLISLLTNEVQGLFEGYQPSKTQGKLLDAQDIGQLSYPLYKKLKYITLKIITDRGVSHELVRHRNASYAQESTRYCNYSKDKFGAELTFIKPLDYEQNHDIYDQTFALIEKAYLELTVDRKTAPQLARSILPNKLKTSIIITASVEEYETIFELRTASNAHPDMIQVMTPIKEYFISQGYLKENTIHGN